MVRDNETNALEVHIKVNGQNFSTIQEKCNVGTLRLPSDPSWPKIPPRRLTSNTDDVIKPPCVITLTRTPRRSRSILRSVTCQHYFRQKINDEYEVNTRMPRKSPGVDPRFRRQIPRTEAEKPDESRDTRNDDKQTEVRLDMCVPPQAKKHEDNSRRTGSDADNEARPCRDTDKPSSEVGEVTKEIVDHPVKEQCTLQADYSANASQRMTDERLTSNIESIFSQEQKAETNMPLLLMVDEKKIHALPINGLNIEAVPSSAQARQCYSVQIPLVAYRNVPLEMPNILTRVQAKARMPCEHRDDSVRREETAVCCKAATLVNSKIRDSKESGNVIQQQNARNESISESVNISYCGDKENIDRSMSANLHAPKISLDDENSRGNWNVIDPEAHVVGKSEIIAKQERDVSKNNGARVQQNITRSYSASFAFEQKGSSEKAEIIGIAESSTRPSTCASTRRRKLVHHLCTKTCRTNCEKLKENIQIGDKGSDENKTKPRREEESHVNLKRKIVSLSLSRKAKSFFRKKSRLAAMDSDCTLLLPGPCCVKGKQCEKTRGRLKVSQLLHRRDGMSSANAIRVRSDTSKQTRASRSPVRPGNPFGRSLFIPLKTQKLLSKSYWEYYRNLQRQIASTEPEDVAARKGKSDENEPCDRANLSDSHQSQTLRQCSVLSCVINNTLEKAKELRDSAEPDDKSISDPIARGSIARENGCKTSGLSPILAKRIKRKKSRRQVSKQLFRLKDIAFLCVMMYIAIIFLYTMYDYYFDEEYDDSENANYIAFAFNYVVSSFEEAFGGIATVLRTVFLRPRSCRKCNDAA